MPFKSSKITISNDNIIYLIIWLKYTIKNDSLPKNIATLRAPGIATYITNIKHT